MTTRRQQRHRAWQRAPQMCFRRRLALEDAGDELDEWMVACPAEAPQTS
jgi:hypothetical protein